MSLPEITIPAVNIPFDIHSLLHPAIVHFAIAIPFLVVIAEILNLLIKGRGVKIISSIMMFLLIVILFATYLTGTVDAKLATDSGFGAIDELKEHKLFGIYLFYGSIFMFLLKMISLAVNKTGFRVFYILVLFGFLAGIIHQGHEGGELVYKHGVNVKIQKSNQDDKNKTTIETQKEEKIQKLAPVKEGSQTILDKKADETKKEVEEKATEVKHETQNNKTEKEAIDSNKTEH